MSQAGKYLKPYQGLKPEDYQTFLYSLLSGQEAGKYLKPYQGLKLCIHSLSACSCCAGKYLKPYQGLKRAVI